jgi:hypothetical protein
MSGFLRSKSAELIPSELCPYPAPIPTQIVSREEYYPDPRPRKRIAAGSFGPKPERKAPLTTTIHEAVVRLGKHSLVSTLASVEVQGRGDAGGGFVQLEPDFANRFLRAIVRTMPTCFTVNGPENSFFAFKSCPDALPLSSYSLA